MSNTPIYYLTIFQISEMIKSMEISSVELTQLMLDRIQKIDGALNSYITVMGDSALKAAASLDSELDSGIYRGPLHGVPIAVKDLVYTKNAPTTGGHAFRMDFIPDYDATIIHRLEEAGAIIIGKLNLCEGAWSGYHPKFKIPKNPWGPFWAGESSSGSGVATAAGLCFSAISTDTAGSIRLPSLANGLVGLKPTFGLVSTYGIQTAAASMDHVGTMSRSVKDAALLLESIAGYDANDPNSLKTAPLDLLTTLNQGIKGIRIGVDQSYITDGVEPSLSISIAAAIENLKDLGAEIIPIEFPTDKEEQNYAGAIINSKEVAISHKDTYPSLKDEYGVYLKDLIDFGLSISNDEYQRALEYGEYFKSKFRKLFNDLDAILAPAGGISQALPEEVMRGSKSGWKPYLKKINWHFAITANLAGTPSLTLPCGEAKNGPPPGFQLMGDVLSEDILCRIGHAFEISTNWNNQHPTI